MADRPARKAKKKKRVGIAPNAAVPNTSQGVTGDVAQLPTSTPDLDPALQQQATADRFPVRLTNLPKDVDSDAIRTYFAGGAGWCVKDIETTDSGTTVFFSSAKGKTRSAHPRRVRGS